MASGWNGNWWYVIQTNGISAVALATGIVNKTHSFINIVSIEG
jgi:hypothetical protein